MTKELRVGHFQYHDFEVSFTISDAEETCRVTCTERGVVCHDESFEDSGRARDRFQEICENVMSRTSRSWVIEYIQQRAVTV